jgi:hypothetical protein
VLQSGGEGLLIGGGTGILGHMVAPRSLLGRLTYGVGTSTGMAWVSGADADAIFREGLMGGAFSLGGGHGRQQQGAEWSPWSGKSGPALRLGTGSADPIPGRTPHGETVQIGGNGLPDYGGPIVRLVGPDQAPGAGANRAAPAPGEQLSLFDFTPAPAAQGETTTSPHPPAATAGDGFVFLPESTLMAPRQLSVFDMKPSVRGPAQAKGQRAAEWNRLMEFLYKFQPKPNATYEMNGVSYTHDAEGRVVRVTSDKNMMGTKEWVEGMAPTRWPSVYESYPGKTPGYDYGHVGGINAFGGNDILIQNRGGYPQEATFNRTGEWAVAEGRLFSAAYELQMKGQPFLKVAEVRNFVNGVPSEWRAHVESNGKIVYDSGWLKAPTPP